MNTYEIGDVILGALIRRNTPGGHDRIEAPGPGSAQQRLIVVDHHERLAKAHNDSWTYIEYTVMPDDGSGSNHHVEVATVVEDSISPSVRVSSDRYKVKREVIFTVENVTQRRYTMRQSSGLGWDLLDTVNGNSVLAKFSSDTDARTAADLLNAQAETR